MAQQHPEKPVIQIVGQDGNIFSIMGRASSALKRVGLHDQAKEMFDRCTRSGSYAEALSIINEYVAYAGIDTPSRGTREPDLDR